MGVRFDSLGPASPAVNINHPRRNEGVLAGPEGPVQPTYLPSSFGEPQQQESPPSKPDSHSRASRLLLSPSLATFTHSRSPCSDVPDRETDAGRAFHLPRLPQGHHRGKLLQSDGKAFQVGQQRDAHGVSVPGWWAEKKDDLSHTHPTTGATGIQVWGSFTQLLVPFLSCY